MITDRSPFRAFGVTSLQPIIKELSNIWNNKMLYKLSSTTSSMLLNQTYSLHYLILKHISSSLQLSNLLHSRTLVLPHLSYHHPPYLSLSITIIKSSSLSTKCQHHQTILPSPASSLLSSSFFFFNLLTRSSFHLNISFLLCVPFHFHRLNSLVSCTILCKNNIWDLSVGKSDCHLAI